MGTPAFLPPPLSFAAHRFGTNTSSCRSYRFVQPVTRCSLPPLPFLSDSRGDRGVRSLSYAQILTQAASSLCEQISLSEQPVKLTIDFPPQASEQSAGTLVLRYENNLNFIEKLMEALGCKKWEQVGGTVEICDNINPQGGGEYLTDDECMVGLKGMCAKVGSEVMVLINAGVDGGTLRQAKDLGADCEVVVLVNCGLERLSWFDKMGFRDYIEGFRTAYTLKMVGGGWLLGTGSYWGVNVNGVNVWEGTERPKASEVERLIRLGLAGSRERR